MGRPWRWPLQILDGEVLALAVNLRRIDLLCFSKTCLAVVMQIAVNVIIGKPLARGVWLQTHQKIEDTLVSGFAAWS